MERCHTENEAIVIEEVGRKPQGWQVLRPSAGNAEAPVHEEYHYVDKPVYAAAKRVFDILLSSFALIVLSPLLLVISLLIVLDDPKGRPLFAQLRGGLCGKRFVFYKFRSMVADAEAQKEALMKRNESDGPAFKITDDPRITRIGRFLRKTSIDELPQLWNIIRGDMSIVGPRPLPIKESEACTPYQLQRLDVKPGLTCYWQANGRDHSDFDAWVALDLQYIMNRSLWTDCKIILKTIGSVLKMDGE